MKEQRNTELNFLYDDSEGKSKKKSKQNLKNKKSKRADKPSAQECDTFNFDNEIVIGVTKVPKQNKNTNNIKQRRKHTKANNTNKQSKKTNVNIERKQSKHAKSKSMNKQSRSANVNMANKQSKHTVLKDEIKDNRKNNKKVLKTFIKWTFLLCALIVAIIIFIMSPVFNITQIEVLGNENIATDTIISLSQITLGNNIYKTNKKSVQANIKENAYIQEVDIKRSLPNKIVITVKERKTTYMIKYANSYAYINNQGFILDISEQKLEVPIISGHITKDEDIKIGGRLYDDDLEKLADVLRIMDSANANEIGNLITEINIQNKQNYTLIMEGEKKIAYLGDASSLSNRMIYLKAILNGEKGIEGEIFVNGDLNKDDAFFRKKE